MAITTLGGLKATTARWLAREDLSAELGDFVELATALFNEKLRVRQMIAKVSLPTTGGAATLPADYLQYRRVVDLSGTRSLLTYLAPDAVEQEYPFNYSGIACHFTIIGGLLQTYPSTVNDVELTYFQKIPALSGDTSTNWLLAEHPELYLRAATAYGADFIKDDAQMQKFMTMTLARIADLKNTDDLANYAKAETWTKGVHP